MNPTELKSQPTIMDCRTFREMINPKRAKYLLSLPDREIKKIFWDKDEQDWDGEKWDWRTYLKSIRSFLRDAVLEIDEEGKIEYERKYKYATGRRYGRLYTRIFGIQSLQARLRNFLITDNDKSYYTDIDMENAHFSILLGLVENYNEITNDEHKLECSKLRKYVNKRKECFEKHKFTKKEALILLNSDRATSNKKNKDAFYVGDNQFLICLFQEIIAIKDAWLGDANYDKYKGDMSGRKNPKSSFLNRVLCDKEAQYLQKVVRLLNEDNDKKHIVPMFDGLLVSCNGEASQGSQLNLLIKDINKLTTEKFGHSIKWIEKPIVDNADILEEEITEADENCELYSVKKMDYESQRCYIKSQVAYQLEYKDKDECMVWSQHSHSRMKEEGLNQRCINDKGEESDMFTEWSKDPNKRTYEDMDYVPYPPNELGTDKPHIFNTFSGMGFNYDEEYSEEEKDPILKEFLLNTICDGDEKGYEYLYNKIAHLIQEPNTNPLVATILSGQEGVGKDSLIYLIRKLIGKNNVCATNMMEDVIPKRGAFNMRLKDKIVIEFNETSGKDGVDYMEQIKDFITREENPIRELYKSPYNQKNLIRLFILTNQLNPIQMKDGQRRFIWFKLNGDRKGDQEYWTEVYSNFDDTNWIDRVGNELLNVDYGDYFTEKKYPETAVMKQYYKLNRSNTMDFIWDEIINGEEKEEDIIYMETKPLYDKYKDYCEDNSLPYGYNGQAWCASHFKKELLDLGVGDNIRRQHQGTQKRMFSFDLKKIRTKLEPKYITDDDAIELDGTCYVMD